jgi:outer membrane lipoprotein SlyB
MQAIKMTVILLLIFTVVGCATSKSGILYTREQARQVQQVESGVVAHVTPVQIEGTKTPIGALGGAAIGSIAGSGIGKGSGSEIAAVAGGMVGWLIGSAAEEGLTRKNALEITVKLDSGKVISVVQEADVPFRVGDRIRLLSGGSETRVAH